MSELQQYVYPATCRLLSLCMLESVRKNQCLEVMRNFMQAELHPDAQDGGGLACNDKKLLLEMREYVHDYYKHAMHMLLCVQIRMTGYGCSLWPSDLTMLRAAAATAATDLNQQGGSLTPVLVSALVTAHLQLAIGQALASADPLRG